MGEDVVLQDKSRGVVALYVQEFLQIVGIDSFWPFALQALLGLLWTIVAGVGFWVSPWTWNRDGCHRVKWTEDQFSRDCHIYCAVLAFDLLNAIPCSSI
jgi:hypothetical protein